MFYPRGRASSPSGERDGGFVPPHVPREWFGHDIVHFGIVSALAFWTGTRPQVVTVSPSIVLFVYSKRTAWAGGLVSRMDDRTFCAVIEGTTRGTTQKVNVWAFCVFFSLPGLWILAILDQSCLYAS